jgi:DNA-binding LytR/AlgR family response regulator
VVRPASLHIAIVEDEPSDAAVLHEFIKASGISGTVSVFSCGSEFLQTFSDGKYDIIFLDIYMNGAAEGIDIAKMIRVKDIHAVIVFVTVSPDYTRDAFVFGALKYLDKPITAEGVNDALSLATFRQKERPAISVRLAGGDIERLPLAGLIYCEQTGYFIEVHLTDRVLRTNQRTRLKDIEAQLPSPPFVRCHKGFIVNLEYIERIDRETLVFHMENGDAVSIRQRDKGKCSAYQRAIDEWRAHKVWRNA